MLPFKLIYHERYDLNLGAHVFPSQKFRLIAEALVAEGTATKDDFLRPEPASDEDILRVHTADWVRKLKTEERLAAIARGANVAMEPDLSEAAHSRRWGILLAAISLGYIAMMAIIARAEPDAWKAAAAGIVPLAAGLGFLLDFALIRRDLKSVSQ